MVQLSHSYMTNGKTIALTIWTFIGKVTCLLFNMLSTFFIAFLSRSKHLFLPWLQTASAVIWDQRKGPSLLQTCPQDPLRPVLWLHNSPATHSAQSFSLPPLQMWVPKGLPNQLSAHRAPSQRCFLGNNSGHKTPGRTWGHRTSQGQPFILQNNDCFQYWKILSLSVKLNGSLYNEQRWKVVYL